MLRSEHAVELQGSGSPHAIGWRVQRLDVHVRDRTDNSKFIMDILADILRRLPNLRVLTFSITGHGYDESLDHVPENVLQATDACRDTLRLLNWYGGVEFSSNSWAWFLENHPQIEAINAPVVLTRLGNSHIVLDSLKSIYVDYRTRASNIHQNIMMLWDINLPNVRHATCHISRGVSTSFDVFLRNMGSRLTSIQFNISTYDYDAEALSRIVAFCTNLTRVDLVFFQWLMPLFTIPKSVHTLGIRINGRQIPRRSMETFFVCLHFLLSLSSSVKRFCFTDQRDVRTLRAHSRVLKLYLPRIHKLDVNVLDHEGRLLVALDESG